MSNHSGSYMLNEIIKRLLEESNVFNLLGREKTQQLVLDIIGISFDYDCNPGEILEGLGERLGICYYCLKPAENFEDGVCANCRKEW